MAYYETRCRKKKNIYSNFVVAQGLAETLISESDAKRQKIAGSNSCFNPSSVIHAGVSAGTRGRLCRGHRVPLLNPDECMVKILENASRMAVSMKVKGITMRNCINTLILSPMSPLARLHHHHNELKPLIRS
jgi:hypothetical protein